MGSGRGGRRPESVWIMGGVGDDRTVCVGRGKETIGQCQCAWSGV